MDKNKNNLLLGLLVSSAMGSIFTSNINALEKKQEIDTNIKMDELVQDNTQSQKSEEINIKINSIDAFKVENNNNINTK